MDIPFTKGRRVLVYRDATKRVFYTLQIGTVAFNRRGKKNEVAVDFKEPIRGRRGWWLPPEYLTIINPTPQEEEQFYREYHANKFL